VCNVYNIIINTMNERPIKGAHSRDGIFKCHWHFMYTI